MESNGKAARGTEWWGIKLIFSVSVAYVPIKASLHLSLFLIRVFCSQLKPIRALPSPFPANIRNLIVA